MRSAAPVDLKILFRQNVRSERLQMIPKQLRFCGIIAVLGISPLPARAQTPTTSTPRTPQVTGAEVTPSSYNARGMAKFRAGDIKGSIQDFDAAIQLRPSLQRSHWQRGISYYYAKSFDLGAKQFELYQSYDAADVENVVWRFLCQAAAGGRTAKAIADARDAMLPLRKADRRIPMMAIDAMFRGSGSPADVMSAAKAGQPDDRTLHTRLFYAHLYVGLFFEASNEPAKARKHLFTAEQLKINHYMWDVAHIHAERLRQSQPNTEN